jgi:ubiquitin carboxyl-terminal hydrolase 5/13
MIKDLPIILLELLFHRGPSVHCGHYVAHIRKDNRWVLFNDNKVAVADSIPEEYAYLLVLERV